MEETRHPLRLREVLFFHICGVQLTASFQGLIPVVALCGAWRSLIDGINGQDLRRLTEGSSGGSDCRRSGRLVEDDRIHGRKES